MNTNEYANYLDKYIHRLINLAKFEEAIEYIDSILPDIVNSKNKKKELDLLIKKGAFLSMMGEYLDAQEINKRAAHLALQLNCIKSEVKILNNSAIISDNVGDSNTAIFQYENALDLAVKSNLMKECGEIKYNLGLVHYRIGNFKLASEYLMSSKKIATEMSDFEGVILCENVLGEITRKNGKPDKALNTHKKLLQMVKKYALTKRIYDVRRNILLDSFAISKNERITQAMETLMNEVEEIESRSLYTQIAYDLAEMYFSLGNYVKALEYLEIAEEHVNMHVRTFLLPSVYTLIAHLNLMKGKRYLKRAERYCLHSLNWAETNSSIKEVAKVYTLLAQISLRANKVEEAYIYFEKAKEKLILIDDTQVKNYIIQEYDKFARRYHEEKITTGKPLTAEKDERIPAQVS